MKMEKKYIITLSIIFALILLLGSTYAYFSIQSSSDQSNAKVSGKAGMLGNPTLTTETSMLYLNLNANLMSQANAGKTYYANKDESGLALETNPNYVLATAQLPEGDEALDCTYTYKVSATIKNAITDNSDNDIKVTIGNKTLTLKEILASTDGIIVKGELLGLTAGTKQSISLTSSVVNTSNAQDNLVDNSYTIKITPYTEGDIKAFSCKEPVRSAEIAQYLIDSGSLWQSGLEGDGYRYVGTGEVGTDTNPNNFICFGTTDKSECTANQDKYMYRIIGVFSDKSNVNHVKLMKYVQISKEYKWNADYRVDVPWSSSDMKAGLNGNYFLTNNEYNYLQNTTWLSKITDWTWISVNTKTDSDGGPDYYNGLTPKQIYLHEMNRSGKTSTIGDWDQSTGKIGLMYASDAVLTLGNQSLSITGGTFANQNILKEGWIFPDNNNASDSSEFTISRFGDGGGGYYYAWSIFISIRLSSAGVHSTIYAIRPVFYLTNNVKITMDGDGSINNPYMIVE